jgi:hypothetical protein
MYLISFFVTKCPDELHAGVPFSGSELGEVATTAILADRVTSARAEK